jgi:quercetin dioxygenase-like cupin family protein
MSHPRTIEPAAALPLSELIASIPGGIASRILAKTAGGSVTLFAFDEGQQLSEHTAPFDALAIVLEGVLSLTVGGQPVVATAGAIVRMPASIPHALEARSAVRMLLVMLRDPAA